MRRYLPLLIMPALGLTACTKTIRVSGAEKAIVNVVEQKTGMTAENPKCPSGITAEKGETFDCAFTAGGTDYVAHMHVQRVKGSKVYFFIQTEPK